jgi:hypothetical protein
MYSFGTGSGPAFGDRLAKADDAGIGMNLQEKPAVIQDIIFKAGNFQFIFGVDKCFVTEEGHLFLLRNRLSAVDLTRAYFRDGLFPGRFGGMSRM